MAQTPKPPDPPTYVESPDVVYITGPRVAFAVLTEEGFGQIEVELQPGEHETITMPNGHQVTVIREYLH